MLGGSNNEAVLKDYFRAHNLQYKQVVFDDQKVMFAAYEAGRCDGAVTGPAILAAERSRFKAPADHIIINDIMAKDPQGPLVREGDSEWADIARMTLAALIAAEELGVTSQNVKAQATGSTNGEVRRLLNAEGNIGSRLGLKKGWAIDVIAAVGNYGEMFERNVGQGSVLKLDRGQNALWTKGGLMMAPPVR
jgi:general L-amino acid transport system substrate-binding protein